MNKTPFFTHDSLNNSAISHGFFTRHGGVSKGDYDSLNCGLGSNDDLENCQKNRRIAATAIGGSEDIICGLYQIHSDICHIAAPDKNTRAEGDALVTDQKNITLAILTADCVPVLLADTQQGIIGAAHAGWRGAVRGIISSTIECMVKIGARPGAIKAVIGPAIQQQSYQVGADLRDEVITNFSDAERHFAEDVSARWKFNLPGFVRDRLLEKDVSCADINLDTYSDGQFFSHRRNTHQNGTDTGRLVSMIRLK